jgi:hypothetical protein
MREGDLNRFLELLHGWVACSAGKIHSVAWNLDAIIDTCISFGTCE